MMTAKVSACSFPGLLTLAWSPGRRNLFRWRFSGPSGRRQAAKGRQGKFQKKAAAAARSAVNFDCDPVRTADRAHDREPKAGASIFTGTRRVDAIKAIENVRQRGSRDADAAIADLKNAVIVTLLRAQPHHAAAGRELDRIVEQIDDHLLEPATVTAYQQRRQRRGLQL